ncbi:MAG: hypothetical protein U5L96_15785 [Owenweeksia sp.]|nr:hypothetical protein [Owenweeksia sp.]
MKPCKITRKNNSNQWRQLVSLFCSFLEYILNGKNSGYLWGGYPATLDGQLYHANFGQKKLGGTAAFCSWLVLALHAVIRDDYLHLWDERYHALVALHAMDTPFHPGFYPKMCLRPGPTMNGTMPIPGCTSSPFLPGKWHWE